MAILQLTTEKENTLSFDFLEEKIREESKKLIESISKKINGKVDVLGFADINSEYNKLSDFLYSEFLYAFSEELNDTLIVERDENVLNLSYNQKLWIG